MPPPPESIDVLCVGCLYAPCVDIQLFLPLHDSQRVFQCHDSQDSVSHTVHMTCSLYSSMYDFVWLICDIHLFPDSQLTRRSLDDTGLSSSLFTTSPIFVSFTTFFSFLPSHVIEPHTDPYRITIATHLFDDDFLLILQVETYQLTDFKSILNMPCWFGIVVNFFLSYEPSAGEKCVRGKETQ